MLNNNENKSMENGYVVLPVEKYNELMKTVRDAEHAAAKLVSLDVDYKKQVVVKIDSDQIYTAAKRLYDASSFNTLERELIAPESFRVYSADFTREVPSEDEE